MEKLTKEAEKQQKAIEKKNKAQKIQKRKEEKRQLLRSLSLGTSRIGIERVNLSKKGSVRAHNWTEKIIIIEI